MPILRRESFLQLHKHQGSVEEEVIPNSKDGYPPIGNPEVITQLWSRWDNRDRDDRVWDLFYDQNIANLDKLVSI